MPVHMMVDLFACADSIRKTRSMYIFNEPSEQLLCSLMDARWDMKYEKGQDVLKCVVSRDSMKFRYHLDRQMLYANFQYVRYRRVERQAWIAIDQAVVLEMVRTTVIFGDTLLPPIEVGRTWPVSHIRNKILIILSRDSLPEEYHLVIQRPGHRDTKVHASEGIFVCCCSMKKTLQVDRPESKLTLCF